MKFYLTCHILRDNNLIGGTIRKLQMIFARVPWSILLDLSFDFNILWFITCSVNFGKNKSISHTYSHAPFWQMNWYVCNLVSSGLKPKKKPSRLNFSYLQGNFLSSIARFYYCFIDKISRFSKYTKKRVRVFWENHTLRFWICATTWNLLSWRSVKSVIKSATIFVTWLNSPWEKDSKYLFRLFATLF